MPERSNDRQRIVYYIRDHLKPEGWEVTESKMFVDRITGEDREVDVVVEGDMPTGEHIVIGIEVVDRSRKADTPYIEQLIEKHRNIATDKLIVVSWMGFYRPALLKAAANDIIAITPEDVDGTWNHSLKFAVFQMTPRRVHVVTVEPDGSIVTHENVPLNVWVYRRGTNMCMELHQFAAAVLQTAQAGDAIAREIIKADDDMPDPWIEYAAAINSREYFVHDSTNDVEHDIVSITIFASMEFTRSQLGSDLQRLGSTLFALTTIEAFGTAINVVMTEGVEPNTAKVSYFTSPAPPDQRPTT